jgi:hypothetical protein
MKKSFEKRKAELNKTLTLKEKYLTEQEKYLEKLQIALSYPCSSWQRRTGDSEVQSVYRTQERIGKEIVYIKKLLKLSDKKLKEHFVKEDEISQYFFWSMNKRKFIVSDDDGDWDKSFKYSKQGLIDYFNELNKNNFGENEVKKVEVAIYRLKHEFNISVK